ncbi:hypothetical protein GW933_04360 [Candidatus Falkowbacteria bacterium]|uniref:Protein kinase domain-containing protein n=1 Tax=Candidatus Buchananbacteria bacterium CG10_big_fil_rev_8_21_14_0_10_33_19 TaxID=1974525 RepID=A0A2H0W550_9BACT|nr:hypothetical protein [Candidatus Falkowbacteria bacterium]PIS06434.1 MAG: hypothetical protein COT80_00635 [Candidatus Buchananbacteria bacterium CG10_big_fil_rev_8_21_14_0_10_33_19]
MKLPRVLSFDSSRVSLVEKNGQCVIVKKSLQREYTQMIEAQRHLCLNPIVIDGLTLRVVPVTNWDNKRELLTTIYCGGSNLEEYLRGCSSIDRVRLLSTLKHLLLAMKGTGFLWGDFAPRNIIIDWFNSIMWLCDFERKIVLRECPVSDVGFTRYIRNYSFEEFSSLLLIEDQNILFDGLFTEEFGKVAIENISSKRKKEILRRLFGNNDFYNLGQLCEVEDLMAFVATPL